MLIPGLVSITFRSLAPEEIIRLAAQADVQSIEWGGDIHVPAGEVDRAREVGRWTREAGLMVSAYGSYYRLGGGGSDAAPFEPIASACGDAAAVPPPVSASVASSSSSGTGPSSVTEPEIAISRSRSSATS